MKKPTSLKEVKNRRDQFKKNIHTPKSRLKKSERIALWVTNKIGTLGFFSIIFFWTVLWLGWNILAPDKYQFDPYPAFVMWLFLSNLIQIFLMPLIMIGQSIGDKKASLQAEHDLAINIKAEKEIEVVLEHLEFQNDKIILILQKLENKS